MICIYCKKEYPEEENEYEVLMHHIQLCDDHPLKMSQDYVQILRDALIKLIGVETELELKAMLGALEEEPDTSDKLAAINAIKALLSTMP